MQPRYGSDRYGLICGFRFAPGAPGVPVSLEEAVAWLQASAADHGFVWLHLSLSDAAAERWISEHLAVAPEFIEALREGSRSTRIEDAHGTLIAVVNDVAYEFAFDPSEIETLWVQVTPRLALSARVHALRSIDRLRHAVKQGLGFGSSVEFLNRLLADQGDVLVHIVRQATAKIDQIEDSLLAGRVRTQRAELGALRRVLVRLQRLLAPEPGALFRLLRQPPAWMGVRDLEDMRQATEEFTLVLRDLNDLQERIKLLQEETAAELNERTGRNLFTLTIVTVLALPINIVAGLFGMNVGGVPLNQHENGFSIVVALIVALTVVLAWFAFRRRD